MAVNMFITFLNMTISGSLAAVLLILWRRATYRYIPSKFYYGLWLVLMCRLVVPFNIKSAFSVQEKIVKRKFKNNKNKCPQTPT